MTQDIAHLTKLNDAWVFHTLSKHLIDTGSLSCEFGKEFNCENLAKLIGLMHDLGKYNPDFQSYILKKSGYTPCNVEPIKIPHAIIGAVYLKNNKEFKNLSKILAYSIAGHHVGLENSNKLDSKLNNSNQFDFVKNLSNSNNIIKELNLPNPDSIIKELKLKSKKNSRHVLIRMLFSCLVDADYLDTESFMAPFKSNLRKSDTSLKCLYEKLSDWITARDETLKLNNIYNSNVNIVRRHILQKCNEYAEKRPGFFTLAVPTGGGKTLSAMSFALKHAVTYNKKRVITVIPYTSIIEQTSNVFADIFGKENVLEHHSNLDPEKESFRSKMIAENWQSPLVVTTNVQFFESLFANKTSKCRKIHNIANSVIILDEAQALPERLLYPTLDILQSLVSDFGCTIVLCTATQPKLTEDIGSGKNKITALNKNEVINIIDDYNFLAKSLKRVDIEFKEDIVNQHGNWENFSKEILENKNALVIVNRKKHSKELFEEVVKTKIKLNHNHNVFHLSALMCGQHRSDVINDIKNKLNEKQSVILISTQLVEAGVDIDFPIVYRAMSGYDSIIQAAGRCNREGKLDIGKTIVFKTQESSPIGLLLKRENATIELLRNYYFDACALSEFAFEKYFSIYYNKVCDFGKKDYEDFLINNSSSQNFDFESAADWYKIIENKNEKSIIVGYGSSIELINDIEANGINMFKKRKLQRYSVSVHDWNFNALLEGGYIREIKGLDLYTLNFRDLYSNDTGLQLI